MAAVLSALAPYVLQMIKDVPEQEVRMLLAVSGEIDKLGDKVGNLEAYVADAERRRIDDARVQRWVRKLKDALYDATDILELCQLHAEENKAQGQGGCWATMEKKAPGCLLPLLFCLRNPAFAHSIGSRIKDLNARLDAIRKDMADFSFVELHPYPLHTVPSDATPDGSRTTTALFDESAVVGDVIEADTKALVQELLTIEPAIFKVVSIVGVGGMGKTTLAKKIFNDQDIQGEFTSRIWLSVTQSYNAKELLTSAITQARGQTNPLGDQHALTQILATTLAAGKFLLVMDDVWSVRPWAHFLQDPVVHAARSKPGSRVIVTTRNEDLVKQMGADYRLHNVKRLHDEDAWSLLRKQLLPYQDVMSDQSALDHLKHIGMGIIRNCDGLPLAIKAIGGLLRMKRATEHDWEGVLHDPTWKTDKAHHDLNTALWLSYDDLSPQLKQCFLYCSLFPKGVRIEDHIVTGMWMSEGFLKVPPSGESRRKEAEDIGTDHYWDLIKRNLIEPDDMSSSDGTVSKMHDVVRSFAQYIAEDEALSIIGPGQLSSLVSSPKFRRLSIESTELESESAVLTDWSGISGKQESLRSLIVNGRIRFEPTISSNDSSSSSRFPSLRALFVRHAESDRFIESVGKLKHLRFLHLESTDISRLPDDIGQMKFLEHIFICDCASFDGQIPSGILKLERLRYLAVGGRTKFSVPKGLGELKNLRTLSRFPAQVDGEWCSLQELGPLSQLRILEVECLEAVPSSSLAAKAKIRDKKQLTRLLLSCYKLGEEERIRVVEEEDCRRVEEVFDQLCPPPHLESLLIENYIGCRPPSWLGRMTPAVVDFTSLTVLEMVSLPCCTQLPNSLCRLPSLETLVIDYAYAIRRVGPEFQQQPQPGRSRSSARAAFPRLQRLRFKVLLNWVDWEWEEEAAAGAGATKDSSIAMPCLHTLDIAGCKLSRLPPGLASSRRLALKKLYLLYVTRITAVESFPSVVTLDVLHCSNLKIIRGFPRMQSVNIDSCPALEVLEGGPALDTVELSDPAMETLPKYLRGLKPRILRVRGCHEKLRDTLLSLSRSDDEESAEYQAEMDKVKHCGKLVVL